MKNVIATLRERGFIDQITSEELERVASMPMKVYIGFDPTAESLHLGNLVGIVALAWMQKFGHTPVAILGGATGRIGDPSGKSAERPLLTDIELEKNIGSLDTFFHQIFQFPEGPKPLVLNNEEWLKGFSFIDFLRDVGKHFRIGPMLAKESVRARLESEEGMSFTEFSYQILQAYDFTYLHQKYGVVLQMGGSDQWGNITAGTELNRKLGQKPVYGLTFPLLTRSDGKKFGKSEEGAIWLSKEKLSPYHLYQYLFSVPDADVVFLLKMLTFLEMGEIREIEASMRARPNEAQKRLALEVTRFVHGEEGVQQALRVTEGARPGMEAKLDKETLERLSKEMPHANLPLEEVIGRKYVDLATKVGLVASKSEGVRLIQNGGAYLNNERVSDPAFLFEKKHLIEGTYLLLSAGKKKRILISVTKSFEK